MELSNSSCDRPMTCSLISVSFDSRIFEPSQFEAECTGAVVSSESLVQCFTDLIRLGRPLL